MKRIVLSLSILLLAATESHALKSVSAGALSILNGSASVECKSTSGSGTEGVLMDADGTGGTSTAACRQIPYCSTGQVLKFDNSVGFSCVSAGGGPGPVLVSQSETRVSYVAGPPILSEVYMGFNGSLAYTSTPLARISNAAVTFKNMVCQSSEPISAGSATVALVYCPTGNYGCSTGSNLVAVSSFSVTLNSTNNGTNSTSQIVTSTSSSIPAEAFIGYRITTASGLATALGGDGASITCSIERAS